ncbi:MAG: hypothetical protein NTX72_00435 [Candidatus Uhrbacteria bacterium]|nr:hypothetical protein [Candidatus Uhrbacteria bacterium]
MVRMITILNFENLGDVTEKLAQWLNGLSPTSSKQALLLKDEKNSCTVFIDGQYFKCPELIGFESRGGYNDGWVQVWMFKSEMDSRQPSMSDLYYEYGNRDWEAVELDYLDELDVEGDENVQMERWQNEDPQGFHEWFNPNE